MAPRNANIDVFALKVTNQDKRDRNNAIISIENQINKNCNVLGFGSVTLTPIVNINSEITSYNLFFPPLSLFPLQLNHH